MTQDLNDIINQKRAFGTGIDPVPVAGSLPSPSAALAAATNSNVSRAAGAAVAAPLSLGSASPSTATSPGTTFPSGIQAAAHAAAVADGVLRGGSGPSLILSLALHGLPSPKTSAPLPRFTHSCLSCMHIPLCVDVGDSAPDTHTSVEPSASALDATALPHAPHPGLGPIPPAPVPGVVGSADPLLDGTTGGPVSVPASASASASASSSASSASSASAAPPPSSASSSSGSSAGNGGSSSSSASSSKTKKPNGLRRGKWTPEEESYANRLIQEFKSGLLPLTDGTTLRTFLSKLLNCDPMRISKKFVGSNCIGKQVFRRRQVRFVSSARLPSSSLSPHDL